MTHTGMFVFVLLVVAWGWLIYLRNGNLQRRLQAQEEERKTNQLLRLRDMEKAEQDYHAMLQRLDVTDRWFRHAWPLRQISLVWSGPPGSLTTGIPAALRAAAGELLQNGEGDFSCGGLADASLPPGLMWHITSRVTETEPSVFMGGYGDQTRPGAWRRGFKYVRMPDTLERVAILMQGTRHTRGETLSLYLLDVADRLERGDTDGVKHDDDSGWAFRTFVAVTATDDYEPDNRMQTDGHLP